MPSTAKDTEKENLNTENSSPKLSVNYHFHLVTSFLKKINRLLSICFQTPKPTFIAYFTENKAELEKEKPELKPNELTKYAMNKFKQLYAGTTNGTDIESNGKDGASKFGAPNAKRKINTEENERSGIAKLARFSFTKQ